MPTLGATDGQEHALVQCHLEAAHQAVKLGVAAAPRHILETTMRLADPVALPLDMLVGPLPRICQQRIDQRNQILSKPDIEELRALLTLARRN